MRPFSFMSPVIFIPMLMLWMYVRQWPWGDISQGAMDLVMLLIAYVVWKRKTNGRII